MLNRLSTFLYQRPRLMLGLLLLPPLIWFVVVYLGSLATMLLNSFFYLDGFTGQVVRQFTLQTYSKLLDPTNIQIFSRTTLMAALVTVACILIAFPLSYYAARFASRRMKTFLSGGNSASLVQLRGTGLFLETDPGSGRDRLLVCPAYPF